MKNGFFLRQRHFETNLLNLGWLLKSFIKGKVFGKPRDPTINPTRVYPRVQGCDAKVFKSCAVGKSKQSRESIIYCL